MGDGFQAVTNLAILHFGFESMNFAFLLAFLVLPYFFFFTYFEQARLMHKQHKNVFKVEVTEEFDFTFDIGLDVQKKLDVLENAGLTASASKR